MNVSCFIASQIELPNYVVHAEKLGYKRVWTGDCTARFADIWMTLALSAERTERIGLGTAVIVPQYREVMTTAAAIATLESLAPRRVVIGIGAGHGQASQGVGPTKFAELEKYVKTLRSLLRGEEIEHNGAIIKMLQDENDTNLPPHNTPFVLAAEGPKTRKLAQETCEGVMTLTEPPPGFNMVARMVPGCVVEDDEPGANERIIEHAGPGGAINYHALLQMQGPEVVKQLPGGAEFVEAMERHPADRRHLHAWSAHITGILPEERAVMTPEVLRQLTFTGSKRDLRDRLKKAEDEGVTEFIYQVGGADVRTDLDRFADMASEYLCS